ncbi:CHAD domain-containing protein [Streptomyces sp. AJS327]|uniref:CHAD domain-containing protein n=1 Tax=Streptomyces sp. AJS327 TaxID=2545265 RepID=UPI0015DDE8E7|nr:CHAD domain-containing protein [Streptomyces sp. AJS327]MBA0053106.1 CHAD domain-containing protein [Streptomyces sp. AJS327]
MPRPGAEPVGPTVAEALGGYLHGQAAELLRGLRRHGETVGDPEASDRTAHAVRRIAAAARRLDATLHTYRTLLDPDWADRSRAELRWLSATLRREYEEAERLERLLAALHRLASGTADTPGAEPPPGQTSEPPPDPVARAGGAGGGARPDDGLPAGVARAGALLDRQLSLARGRAHSAALRALRSSRFHAAVDTVALLASEAPLAPGTADADAAVALGPPADAARTRLTEAVAALPLARAEAPYNAEALARSLTAGPQQDAAWHRVRAALRRHRYARELPREAGAPPAGPRLTSASAALERHRVAAEAAAAASAAARTPRIAPATAYALGVLHADQRHEVEAARFAFGRLWSEEHGRLWSDDWSDDHGEEPAAPASAPTRSGALPPPREHPTGRTGSD